MLSVVVDRPNSLNLREMPLPEPAAGEVRVRVRYAGICGSDLHIFRGHNPFVSYPRVIGHEFVGRVESVGTGVDAARIGLLGFSSTPSAIAQQELTRKELTLCASWLNFERGLVTPASIVTHKVDFREVGSAFELAEGNPKEACKVLLDFGG
ncbi:alcohol dehydrogenase catalytic domain-containing protein [Burkholderia gladioli]|uniref:alcohol dehydrogenase catalytic domain-containing protein n=1 Tax=Burkholderia gladioli TaxID=28095 RepID=UPI003F7A14C5